MNDTLTNRDTSKVTNEMFMNDYFITTSVQLTFFITSAICLGFAYKASVLAKRQIMSVGKNAIGDVLYSECLNNQKGYIIWYTIWQLGNFATSVFEMNYYNNSIENKSYSIPIDLLPLAWLIMVLTTFC